MATKTLKASVIIGGAMSSSFKGALATTENGLRRIGAEIANVDKRQRLLSRGIDNYRRMGRNADSLVLSYSQLTKHSDRLRIAQARLSDVQKRMQANDARRQMLGGKLRGAIGTVGAVAAATMFPIRAASDFESAMLGVAKQLNGARDAGGNLTPVYFGMARQIQRMGREIPIATNELAAMVAAGLRMGVASDKVIGFTRTAAMMADAFELPAAQLADDMGKIAGLFRIPIPRIGELADAINHLDDNAQSTGGDIIDVMRRVGGMAQTLKMPAKEAAALGSTFLSLGSAAEVAGTASNAMMQILGAATAQSKRVRKGLESIGLDPAAVQASMAKDATGTILNLLDKLNSLGGEQRMVATARIFGKEYGDDIAKLATGTAEYRRQLALVNGEANKGSVSREFQARLKTSGAQWEITKNRLREVSVTIGNLLLPAVTSLMKAAAPMLEGFADWNRQNPKLTKGIIGAALAVSTLRVATLGLGYAWTIAKVPVLRGMALIARWRADGAIAAMGRLGGTATRVGGIVRTVGMIVGGLGAGPIAIVVGALIAAGLVIRKYWQPIAAWIGGFASGLRSSLAPAFDALGQALQPFAPAFQAIGSMVGKAWDWFVKLLQPVNLTSKQFDEATSAGRNFGQIVGGAISWVVNRVTAAVRVFGQMKASIGGIMSTTARTFAPMTGGLSTVGYAALSGKQPTASPAPAAPRRGKSPPALPAGAARGAAAPVTDQRQYAFHITQQPGESSEDLARRIAAETKKQDGIARRGSLVDTL